MKDYQESIKDYYQRCAAEYDDAYLGTGLYANYKLPSFSEEELRALEHAISELPPGHVLDVVCGIGFLTRHLRGKIIGLNQSDAMLKITRERGPGARLVRGNAPNLPCHFLRQTLHRQLLRAPASPGARSVPLRGKTGRTRMGRRNYTAKRNIG